MRKILEQQTHELNIKGSKFICNLFPVKDEDDIKGILLKVTKEHFKASHNTYAYILNQNNFKYSDDGEPAKTAGAPLYDILKGEGLIEVLCIVTRYFGGTKLGVGGLITAYSNALKETLQLCTYITYKPSTSFVIATNYENHDIINHVLKDYEEKDVSIKYESAIEFQITLPTSDYEEFCTKIKGKLPLITIIKTNEKIRSFN